ncbi:MAG TPA: HPr(Ser) kinase/phosphatase, partial [Vicinamibacterales bacterium]|nr:HPr(Ser) kinase/phosphatase [Vicinamibacterales bacterium]
MPTTPAVTVGSLLGARAEAFGLKLEVLAGQGGLSRRITSPHVQKTGLALAGYHEYIHPGRVLVFGQSEVSFLDRQPAAERRAIIAKTIERDVPCVLSTAGCRPPAESLEACDAANVPVLLTPIATGVAIARLTGLLEDSLAEREIMHAVLMDILGLGVLITGESGIGKSECALDLIGRGHRLVADDTVEVRRRAETVLIGTCPELTRHHVEVRGLGLIDVRELFGIAAVRSSKRVELVVQLERWEPGREYERLGLDESYQEILGIRIPLVRMPVAPGRALATLVEVAA